MTEVEQLETYADELMEIFGVSEPPIPLEPILQDPPGGLWKQVDITQLSGTFLAMTSPYSPRMSVARLLARHVANSGWGKERDLGEMFTGSKELLHAFARMLIMPRSMVKAATDGELNPSTLSLIFEAPEDDAGIRLEELGL